MPSQSTTSIALKLESLPETQIQVEACLSSFVRDDTQIDLLSSSHPDNTPSQYKLDSSSASDIHQTNLSGNRVGIQQVDHNLSFDQIKTLNESYTSDADESMKFITDFNSLNTQLELNPQTTKYTSSLNLNNPKQKNQETPQGIMPFNAFTLHYTESPTSYTLDFNPSRAVAEKDFEENYGEYDRVTLEYEPEDNTEYGYNYDDEDEEEAKWRKQKHAEELREESDTSDDGSNCSLYWIKKSRGAGAKPALLTQINDVYRRMLGTPI